MNKPIKQKLEAWRPWHYVFDSGFSKIPVAEKELVLTRQVTAILLNAMVKRRT